VQGQDIKYQGVIASDGDWGGGLGGNALRPPPNPNSDNFPEKFSENKKINNKCLNKFSSLNGGRGTAWVPPGSTTVSHYLPVSYILHLHIYM